MTRPGRAPSNTARNWLGRLEGLAAHARRAAEGLASSTLGRDFEERACYLRNHYAERGDDPFGLDPEIARPGVLATAFFYRQYFRTEVHGIEHVPAARALLIANHSGQIAIDAIILVFAMFIDATPTR